MKLPPWRRMESSIGHSFCCPASNTQVVAGCVRANWKSGSMSWESISASLIGGAAWRSRHRAQSSSDAFETLGARELFAGHHPDNAASRHMLEKSGFSYTHDELYPPTGEMDPGYVLRRR